MKIFVGIPVYDGKLPVQTVRCILEEQVIVGLAGDEIQFRFLPNCSHPAMGRNQLVQDFLSSDCDRLVFLDSDVTCSLGSLLKIARAKEDFVGGAYRFKLEEESYPVGWIEGDLWANENRLLEVQTLPGGFLSLSRKVFDAIEAANPEKKYQHFGKAYQAFFYMPWSDGYLCGEDSYFCQLWRKTGGKVFLDPELTLTHWDYNTPYVGHIGNWLKKINNIKTG